MCIRDSDHPRNRRCCLIHRRSISQSQKHLSRGKTRRPKHVNLLDRLDSHRDEVLRYAHNLNVPFTNNGSEQDVRPVKIRMKIAGCLRTMTGAEAFCRHRSYLSTARKNHQSAYQALRMLHDGNPWTPAQLEPG